MFISQKRKRWCSVFVAFLSVLLLASATFVTPFTKTNAQGKSSVTVIFVDAQGNEIPASAGDSWGKYYEEGVPGEAYKGPRGDGNMGPAEIPGYTFIRTQKPGILARDSKMKVIWDETTCSSLFVKNTEQTIKHIYRKNGDTGNQMQNKNQVKRKTISNPDTSTTQNINPSPYRDIASDEFMLKTGSNQTIIGNGQTVSFYTALQNKSTHELADLKATLTPKNYHISSLIVPVCISSGNLSYAVYGANFKGNGTVREKLSEGLKATEENIITVDKSYDHIEILFTGPAPSTFGGEDCKIIASGKVDMGENDSWNAGFSAAVDYTLLGGNKKYESAAEDVLVKNLVFPELVFEADKTVEVGNDAIFKVQPFRMANEVAAKKMSFLFELPDNADVKQVDIGDYSGVGSVEIYAIFAGGVTQNITSLVNEHGILGTDLPDGIQSIRIDLKDIEKDVQSYVAPFVVFDTTGMAAGTVIGTELEVKLYSADEEKYAQSKSYSKSTKCGRYEGNPATIKSSGAMLVGEDYEVFIAGIKNKSTLPIQNINTVIGGLEDSKEISTGKWTGKCDKFIFYYKGDNDNWQILKNVDNLTDEERVSLPEGTTEIRLFINKPTNDFALQEPVKIYGNAPEEKIYRYTVSTVALDEDGEIAFLGRNTETFAAYIMSVSMDMSQAHTTLRAGTTVQRYSINLSRSYSPFALKEGEFVINLDPGFRPEILNIGNWTSYQGGLSVYVVKDDVETKIGTYAAGHTQSVNLSAYGAVEQVIVRCTHLLNGNAQVKNMYITGKVAEDTRGTISASASFSAKFRNDEPVMASRGPLHATVTAGQSEIDPPPGPDPGGKDDPTNPEPEQPKTPELSTPAITVDKNSVGYGKDAVIHIGSMNAKNMNGGSYVLTIDIPENVQIKSVFVPYFGQPASTKVVYANGSLDLGISNSAQTYNVEELHGLNIKNIVISVGGGDEISAEGSVNVTLKNISANQFTAALSAAAVLSNSQGDSVMTASTGAVEIRLLSPDDPEPEKDAEKKDDNAENDLVVASNGDIVSAETKGKIQEVLEKEQSGHEKGSRSNTYWIYLGIILPCIAGGVTWLRVRKKKEK